jgi:hypothetical protein
MKYLVRRLYKIACHPDICEAIEGSLYIKRSFVPQDDNGVEKYLALIESVV